MENFSLLLWREHEGGSSTPVRACRLLNIFRHIACIYTVHGKAQPQGPTHKETQTYTVSLCPNKILQGHGFHIAGKVKHTKHAIRPSIFFFDAFFKAEDVPSATAVAQGSKSSSSVRKAVLAQHLKDPQRFTKAMPPTRLLEP